MRRELKPQLAPARSGQLVLVLYEILFTLPSLAEARRLGTTMLGLPLSTVSERARGLNLMQEIRAYNYVDCRVMWEILDWLLRGSGVGSGGGSGGSGATVGAQSVVGKLVVSGCSKAAGRVRMPVRPCSGPRAAVWPSRSSSRRTHR